MFRSLQIDATEPYLNVTFLVIRDNDVCLRGICSSLTVWSGGNPTWGNETTQTGYESSEFGYESTEYHTNNASLLCKNRPTLFMWSRHSKLFQFCPSDRFLCGKTLPGVMGNEYRLSDKDLSTSLPIYSL